MAKRTIGIIAGTRPEVIKMAPVIRAVSESESLRPVVISTGQQRELAAQAFSAFGITPDVDLDLMKPGQGLGSLTARILTALEDALPQLQCDAMLVHGDTTTAFAGAISAFYQHIPIGHVEAGLRTYDYDHPWPEEMNRRLVDPICRWCFAPTTVARDNLLREGIPESSICVTGNTVIDTLLQRYEQLKPFPESTTSGRRRVLVTGHRRESFGEGLLNICSAIRSLADERDDVEFVYPVHLNPNVREPVMSILGGHDQISLIEPVGYDEFIRLMDESYFILTDSGGVQEEAPSLGKPVLVMRETTERPEGVDAGTCSLVGTDPHRIVPACTELLDNAAIYQQRAGLANPYGDGTAALRIASALRSAMA